jgi:hypothetical protein
LFNGDLIQKHAAGFVLRLGHLKQAARFLDRAGFISRRAERGSPATNPL